MSEKKKIKTNLFSRFSFHFNPKPVYWCSNGGHDLIDIHMAFQRYTLWAVSWCEINSICVTSLWCKIQMSFLSFWCYANRIAQFHCKPSIHRLTGYMQIKLMESFTRIYFFLFSGERILSLSIFLLVTLSIYKMKSPSSPSQLTKQISTSSNDTYKYIGWNFSFPLGNLAVFVHITYLFVDDKSES